MNPHLKRCRRGAGTVLRGGVNTRLTVFFYVLLLCLLGSAPAGSRARGVSARATPSCPTGAGWSLVQGGRGVALCRKGSFYVTVADLSSGARIRNMYQFSGAAGSSTNPNPRFYGRDIREWWAWASAGNVANKPAGALFAVTNGAFFRVDNPSFDYFGDPSNQRFSFPMKDRGLLRTIGEDPGTGTPLREFRMNDADADIKYYATNPRNWNDVYNLLGPFTSVVGLHPGNDDLTRTGRTYLGLRDNNGDGKYETVYIFSSNAATQPDAYNSLTTDFRTVVNMQFDGSGSAQMECRGTEYVPSTDPPRRNFPHGFAVYEAP